MGHWHDELESPQEREEEIRRSRDAVAAAGPDHGLNLPKGKAAAVIFYGLHLAESRRLPSPLAGFVCAWAELALSRPNVRRLHLRWAAEVLRDKFHGPLDPAFERLDEEIGRELPRPVDPDDQIQRGQERSRFLKGIEITRQFIRAGLESDRIVTFVADAWSAAERAFAKSARAKLWKIERSRPFDGDEALTPLAAPQDPLHDWRWSGLPDQLRRLSAALEGKGRVSTRDLCSIEGLRRGPSKICSDHRAHRRWSRWLRQWIGREHGSWWLKPPVKRPAKRRH